MQILEEPLVDRIIDEDAVALLRERYDILFAGIFESGLAPDEVNWRAGRDAADMTRQICNGWKADRYVAGVILDGAIGRACAALCRVDAHPARAAESARTTVRRRKREDFSFILMNPFAASRSDAAQGIYPANRPVSVRRR